jgi:two-component system CheB/CheR fusion protein
MDLKVTPGGNGSAGLFPIIGIGASAGGLNSLECFLLALPHDFDFAIVFIQHLSAMHGSLLPELLQKRLPHLKIHEISEGLEVLSGRLYLCRRAKTSCSGKGHFMKLPVRKSMSISPSMNSLPPWPKKPGNGRSR